MKFIEKWLYAHAVPSQEQPLPPLLPYGKGENTVKPVKAPLAPLGIGIVPYYIPGSIELADATLEQIKTHDVVLWEKHGTVAVGTDIMDAFDQTDVLCKAANIYMCARNMGSEPDGMTEADIKEIQDVFKLPKVRPC